MSQKGERLVVLFLNAPHVFSIPRTPEPKTNVSCLFLVDCRDCFVEEYHFGAFARSGPMIAAVLPTNVGHTTRRSHGPAIGRWVHLSSSGLINKMDRGPRPTLYVS